MKKDSYKGIKRWGSAILAVLLMLTMTNLPFDLLTPEVKAEGIEKPLIYGAKHIKGTMILSSSEKAGDNVHSSLNVVYVNKDKGEIRFQLSSYVKNKDSGDIYLLEFSDPNFSDAIITSEDSAIDYYKKRNGKTNKVVNVNDSFLRASYDRYLWELPIKNFPRPQGRDTVTNDQFVIHYNTQKFPGSLNNIVLYMAVKTKTGALRQQSITSSVLIEDNDFLKRDLGYDETNKDKFKGLTYTNFLSMVPAKRIFIDYNNKRIISVHVTRPNAGYDSINNTDFRLIGPDQWLPYYVEKYPEDLKKSIKSVELSVANSYTYELGVTTNLNEKQNPIDIPFKKDAKGIPSDTLISTKNAPELSLRKDDGTIDQDARVVWGVKNEKYGKRNKLDDIL